LQEQLQAQIESRNQDARRSLLENFDVDVVARLNMRRESTQRALDEYQQRLLLLARMSLPRARFDGVRFELEGHWYDPSWQRAQESDTRFLRPNDGKGRERIEQAKKGLPGPAPTELVFHYRPSEDGQWSDVLDLLGQSGELLAEKLTLVIGKQRHEHLLLA